jgi:hypothetical protein
MNIGDVVTMTHCTVVAGHDEEGKRVGTMGYKTPEKNQEFVFIYLGIGTPDEPVDPSDILNKLGWQKGKV